MSSVRRRRFQRIGGVLSFYRPGLPFVNNGVIAMVGLVARAIRVTFDFLPLQEHMLEAVAMSDKGCVRGNNEDCCQIQPELGLYVLADGMGGAKAGECA